MREPKYFFQVKAKTFFFFFSKQHICSKYILLDLYVRVFLEPNIHGYIVYMFVYTCILDIWVRVYMSRDMARPTKWLCAQRRSAWASAQSDQSLRCPHEEALGPWLRIERTAPPPPNHTHKSIWKYQIKWNHFHHMGPEFFIFHYF